VKTWLEPEPTGWWETVDNTLIEDLGSGDLTAGCFEPDETVRWYIEAQADGILCGVGIAEFLLGPQPGDAYSTGIEVLCSDSSPVRRGTHIIEGEGPARHIMAAERTALNFVMHLSGVATLTRQYVDRVEGTHAKIVDTRKTLPGLRTLQKYAVRCGGGFNHRMGLYDGAMVKDNHIRATGSITEAVRLLKTYVSHMVKIEVECENLNQVHEAVKAGADVILLDNMDPFMMREAVKTYKGKILFEASGGVSLETVRGVAQTGVDLISVGALTHSAVALSFHLEVE
jgi:nicotinate-nucleotide pyrophosphorylase (carboxylating)